MPLDFHSLPSRRPFNGFCLVMSLHSSQKILCWSGAVVFHHCPVSFRMWSRATTAYLQKIFLPPPTKKKIFLPALCKNVVKKPKLKLNKRFMSKNGNGVLFDVSRRFCWSTLSHEQPKMTPMLNIMITFVWRGRLLSGSGIFAFTEPAEV